MCKLIILVLVAWVAVYDVASPKCKRRHVSLQIPLKAQMY